MKEPGTPVRAGRFVTTTVDVEGREETRLVEVPPLELPAWDADAALTIVGESPVRSDAIEKVTGRARYTADIVRPGMLHAVLLRSPIACGRITRLDLGAALACPGVRGAIARADVPSIKLDGVALFDPAIHYAGQPLAAICADSLEEARHALDAAVLEVEPAPHAATHEESLASDAPRVRPKGNTTRGSPRIIERGDVEAGLRDADVVIEREYRTPVVLHTALEPHGAVAEWNGGDLTVWESAQGIFMTRENLASALDLQLSRVRVIMNYMGGGFGAKNGASHATYTAALLSRKCGRPVRCILDREGEQLDTGNRPASVQRVVIGARLDGTLTSISLDSTVTLGIGGWQSSTARVYHELYRCPNVRSAETFVYTNTGAMTSFRAPGSVEGAFGLESAMDALAARLEIDPLELRRINYVEHDQAKRRAYSGKRLDDCYRIGAERFGWAEARARDRGDGHLRRGVGMASLVWGAGGGPPAYASVRLNSDGTTDVLTGSQDLGTGSRTILAQIAAEELGADPAAVRTVLGDTERLPYAPNSWGSMTTPSVGPAVRIAAAEARDALLEAAALILKADPASLEARGGLVFRRGRPEPAAEGTEATGDSQDSVSFAEVCERLGDVMISGHGSRGPNLDDTTIGAFGAQFAEVEVDARTGHVKVLRFLSVHDSGRIVNPRLAGSQVQGGIIQGIGHTLFEERVLDSRSGIPMNPNMHDYKIPTIADIPAIETIFVGGSDPAANNTGAKGLAEPPIIGVAPAIANAIAHATGVEMAEFPLTRWRVLAALGEFGDVS